MNDPIHILVIEGRYYHHISDALLLGAEMALRELGATWEVVTVPGALEIPQVLSAAVSAGLFKEENAQPFHGCVALGCVIRGETSHFDIVAYESARGLLALATLHSIPAVARASVSGKNKGHEAAEACLEVLRAKRDFRKRHR